MWSQFLVNIFNTTATNPNRVMALLMLILLSLLLGILPGNPTEDCPAICTVDKWNWTVNCFQTSSNPDRFKLVVQTSDHCVLENSPDINKTNCLSMDVKNDCIKLDNDKNCRCNSLPDSGIQCGKNITDKTCINFQPGEKICISLTNNGNVRMKFNCTQQRPAEICNYTNMQFYSEKKIWIDALEYCQEIKSSLLEITNQSEECIRYQFSQHNSSSQTGAWIGLERSVFGNDPKWQWISGSQVNYSLWNGGFPVNSLNNHCGKIIMVNETKEIKWLDANCHEKLPFICQSLNSSLYPAKAPTLNAELCIDPGQSCNSSGH